MLALLGWSVGAVGLIGAVACFISAVYHIIGYQVDPEARPDLQRKLAIGFAASFGFFLVFAVGCILLQVSGAYGPAR